MIATKINVEFDSVGATACCCSDRFCFACRACCNRCIIRLCTFDIPPNPGILPNGDIRLNSYAILISLCINNKYYTSYKFLLNLLPITF